MLWTAPPPAHECHGYLRSLFTAGALAVIRYAKIHDTKHPAIGTTHMCQCIIECGLLTGTRSAEGIMASGHANRATGRTHGCTDQRRGVTF
jgi:hypothetical protein